MQGGVPPLDIGAIRNYADYFKISNLDEREEVFLFVAALDDVYCEVMNKRLEESSKPK